MENINYFKYKFQIFILKNKIIKYLFKKRNKMLNKNFFNSLLKSIILISFFIFNLSFASKLEDIKKSGLLRVAIFDSNPPFGKIDLKNHSIIGYDADFSKEIANILGVKLKLIPTNPSNRIPLLQSGKVDLIIADITITKEREKVINFSVPYFVTHQKLLVNKYSSNELKDYSFDKIGAVKGTTGQKTLHDILPKAQIISYEDIPMAFSALRNGNVKAITQDSTILSGLLLAAPDKDKYKILQETISKEVIGIGVKKGEDDLLSEVNKALKILEESGKKLIIYNKWFGNKK
ncbi:fliY [Wigglesworthia glossinidia endosymbiont of Glossina brevipalpis]|uniref:FliY protein n=1 Tax=Wigglesworthia glossinidia brevipalpis TaxID=36870 RepID=Q8D310_WIGBR|nr:fliY [Wigglesworthia glossinidia endosymbiont of Glossina brevipalpis]